MIKSYRLFFLLLLLCTLHISTYSQIAWKSMNSGTTADLNDICCCSIYKNGWYAGSRLMVVGDSGKILYSDDNGLKWNSISNPYKTSFKAICFCNRDTGIVIGGNGEIASIIRKEDAYEIRMIGSVGCSLNDITSGFSSSDFYCVGDSGKIFRSTDRGLSWWPYLPFPLVNRNLRTVCCDYYYGIYISGDSGTLIKTTRANLWEMVALPQEHQLKNYFSILFLENAGWITGERGTILYSQTGGHTWMSQNSGVDVTLRSIYFCENCDFPDGTGWVAGDSGVILKTTDYGSHWISSETGTNKNLCNIYFTDRFTGIAIGDDGTILRTVTGGSSLPSLEAIPHSLSIGPAVVDSLKKSSIIVYNQGVIPLEISNVYSDNSNFMVSPDNGVVQPFSSFVFSVVFSPDYCGDFNGNIFFTDNAQGSPHAVAVSGVGMSYPKSAWQWQNPIPLGNVLNDAKYIGGTNIICIGEKGTVMKSTDGGVGWSVQTCAGGTINNLNKVCFVTDEIGFAIGEYGSLIKTTDSGESWMPLNIGTSLAVKGISFTDEMNGFVVGSDYCGVVYRTTDGGNNWELQYANPYVILNDLDAITPLNVIAVGMSWDYTHLILQTTDGGTTWHTRFNRLYYGLNAVQFIDGNSVVSVSHVAILRSSDSGLSWEVVDYNYHDLMDISFFDNLRGIAVGGYGDIMITHDGGLNWSCFSLEYDYGFQSIDWSGDIMYSIIKPYYSRNSCIKKSSNEGISWDRIAPVGIISSLRSVSYSGVMNGLAAGDSGRIMTTSDGGETWIQRLKGTVIESAELPFKSVVAVSTSEFTAVGAGGTILYTSDSGNSWQEQESGTISNLYSIFYYDSNAGWAVGSDGTVLATTNRGTSWMNQTGLSANDLFSISFTSADIGIAVGKDGIILRTTNGGVDWITVSSGTSSDLFNVSLHNDSGYAVGWNGMVLQTTDQGKTWNRLMVHTWENLYSVHMTVNNNVTIAGANGTILQTSDGGNSWYFQYSNTGNDLFAVHFSNADIGTVVGEGGTILHTTTGGVVSVRESGDTFVETPNKFVLHQNYPNPFNSETSISFALPRQSKVTIIVYDIIGREVARLEKGLMSPGTHQIAWNAAELASGIYFYKMEAGIFTAVNKMLIVK